MYSVISQAYAPPESRLDEAATILTQGDIPQARRLVATDIMLRRVRYASLDRDIQINGDDEQVDGVPDIWVEDIIQVFGMRLAPCTDLSPA